MRRVGFAALGQSLIAGLALAVGATSALAHGGGGGGGHGHSSYTVVVVGVGRSVQLPAFRGAEASMLLEVTDAPVTATEGDIHHGDVIAIHTVRAADAVVLLDTVKGRRRDIPAGTALVKMKFVQDAGAPDPSASAADHPSVWCDVRPTGRPLWPQEHDCLEDTKGDGHFDRLWQGDSLSGFLGLGMSGVGYFNDPMAAPAAYRAATPAERPTARLGYRYCDGDGVSGPPRFAIVLATADNPGAWPLAGDCRAGVWPDTADHRHVDVDSLHLTVAPAGQGALHYQLANQLPAEAIAPIGFHTPVTSLAAARLAASEAADERALLRRQDVLEGAGQPVKLFTGSFGPGQSFLVAPVKHAITGVLRNEVRAEGGLLWSGNRELKVGQPVFGVAAPNLPADGIVWCAPQRTKDGIYLTDCLRPLGVGYAWLGERDPAMGPTAESMEAVAKQTLASNDPTVERGAADLPPMTVSLRLMGVRPPSASYAAPIYDIDVDLDWGEGPQAINHWSYALTPQGRTVRVLGATLVLKPGTTPGQMRVEIPPPNAEPVDHPTPPPGPSSGSEPSGDPSGEPSGEPAP